MRKRHVNRQYILWKIELKEYEELHENTFENLDERQIPKKCNLPKWINVERESMNSLIIIIREIESILKNLFLQRKSRVIWLS